MSDAASEAEIHEIIEARAEAVHAGDVEALIADVADNAMIFDVIDPLRSEGSGAARVRAEQWLATYNGPPRWENRDVRVFADGDVAFSHSLSHVTGKLKSGDGMDMWFRTTLGFRRNGGRWMIVHDHGSVPFDPENGKASLGLKP